MIPKQNINLAVGTVKLQTVPTRTYKIDFGKKQISGFVDDKEALKQELFLLLNTERYRYMIYSWGRGVELEGLIGQPTTFVLPEIRRYITEALEGDERIEKIKDFKFEIIKNAVHVTFTVKTIFGEIETEAEVRV